MIPDRGRRRRSPLAPFGPVVLGILLLFAGGCWSMRPSRGGGETSFTPPRTARPADVAVPEGYRVEAVVTGLDFPVGVVFDGEGVLHVVEAGYSYGEVWSTPRLLRVEPGGTTRVVAEGDAPPWTGAAWHDGAFIVSEGGEANGGRIVRITPGGERQVLASGLPSLGDHHTNGPAIGPDGAIWFGQGTATNSAVVGPDNATFGWLLRHPEFHDTPCRDVTLRGENYPSDDARKDPGPGAVRTGAYLPYATPSSTGQVVPGKVPCNGAVLRVPAGGGPVEVVAWGLRNPFGLAFGPDGTAWVTENGADERGSRPIFGAPDVLWKIEPGAWYGWPDFVAGRPVTDPAFGEHGPPPRQLLAQHPATPPRPAAVLGVHASANGLDIGRSERFGHRGHAFVALFGDMAPDVGKVMAPVGFKVVRVDPSNGTVEDFVVNRGRENGPASRLGGGGLERPVAARFDPSGDALYVVDFGVLTMGPKGPEPRRGTGVIWRVTRAGSAS